MTVNRGTRWLPGFVLGLGLIGLMMLTAMRVALPVFRFPQPTGRYDIGTVTYHWVDEARPEFFSADPHQRRELMVQVWYPSRHVAFAQRAPYVPHAAAVTDAFARLQGKPAFIFRQFSHVTTNASVSVPVADDAQRFPVLLFLEGATGFRQMNTFQVEELVSHGYIVAAIDQPGAAATVVFPNGRQIVALSVEQLRALIQPSYMPGAAAPLLHGRALPDAGIVPYLTEDVSFVIDRLTAADNADPHAILTGRLDMRHLGAFGVSLGGIVVGDACRSDPRIAACLMMDAPVANAVVSAGLMQPSMWITRDASSMRLERQRSGGWPEAEIAAHLTSMRAAYTGARDAAYVVQIPRTFHSNFTDVPNWSPLMSRLGVAGPIDHERAHAIINAFGLAFFDRHLKGHSLDSLAHAVAKYSDAHFESRNVALTGVSR